MTNHKELKRWCLLSILNAMVIAGGVMTGGTAAFAEDANAFAREIAAQKSLKNEELEVIANQHMEMGQNALKEKDYESALEEFDIVLELFPSHREAKTFRMKAISMIAGKTDPEGSTSMSKSPKARDAMEAYRQGLKAFRAGDLDLAVTKLKISTVYNENYIPAKRLLKRVYGRQKEQLDRDYDVLTSERINDVRSAWLPEGRANKITTEMDDSPEIISPQKQKMIEASQQIIPEINFTQAHIRDVLQYLSKITGVNIILDERVFDGSIPVSMMMDSDSSTLMDKPVSAPISETITISLTNIPLIEALRYILKIKGLKYRIDEYAIMVSTPEGIGEEDMETRYYQLSSGIGDFTEFKPSDDMANAGGLKSGETDFGVSVEEEKTTIKDVLINSGVPFPPSSSVFMDKRTGTLIVHNTPENLAMVEKILKIIDKSPFQVNIQAKFVRIGQSDLEELGFEWSLLSSSGVGPVKNGIPKYAVGPLTSDTATGEVSFDPLIDKTTGLISSATGAINGINDRSPSVSNAFNGTTLKARGGSEFPNFLDNNGLFSVWGILTDPQFRVVIHALNKSGNADLLSAPSVTTVNNQQAQIELVDEIIYPGEYDLQPPTIAAGTATVTPGFAVPGDFLTRDVGVILNVTPSVGSDRKTITLTLIPEVSEFLGWQDFGTTFEFVVQRNGNDEVNSQTIPILQPIFRTQNVSTTVVVNDGETIVLGGLIEEEKMTVRNKIPLLGDLPLIGRFFRHDYDDSRKLNLMIFVTAKLIDANGEDLHPSVSNKSLF